MSGWSVPPQLQPTVTGTRLPTLSAQRLTVLSCSDRHFDPLPVAVLHETGLVIDKGLVFLDVIEDCLQLHPVGLRTDVAS